MDYRTQIAHHEAAHVVISSLFGGGPMLHGIDINTESSVAGAFGNASVGTLNHDSTLPLNEQQLDLVRNIAIICAGAAADARTTGRSLTDTLSSQPSDLAVAKAAIAQSTLVNAADEDECNLVLGLGAQEAQKLLDRADIWTAVELIASACLENGGLLSKDKIETILSDANLKQ